MEPGSNEIRSDSVVQPNVESVLKETQDLHASHTVIMVRSG